MRHLDETVQLDPPRVIGLDGIELKGKGRFVVITDLEQRAVLHMWNYSRKMRKKDSKAAVKALAAMLREINGADQIEVVVIDMSKQFRLAIKKALPQATLVIDRYHIQRMANEAIDRTRIRLHKEIMKKDRKGKMCHAPALRMRPEKLKPHEKDYIEEWFKVLPILGRAYEAKEQYRQMWKLESEAEARKFYEKWSRQFAQTVRETPEQAALRRDFGKLLTAMRNWRRYIFNYFGMKKKYTNAFTEASNRRIRDIRRESRRVSIPVLRAKLIYGAWLKKRLAEEQKLWGKSRVQPARTRRPSEKKPGKSLNSKSTNKTVARRQTTGGQQSLFEW